MKDLEKIKSEDLGCQVQDANPGNFAIEQEVAQLVGATVPAPTEPSDDDARELGAQLSVFLRRALLPIRSALRTALAAIYAHLDSRCTDYTPAAYAPYIPRPYDPMGTLPARSVANLLTALTAFDSRKISNGSAPNDGIPDGVSLAHVIGDSSVHVTKLIDDNEGWTLTRNISTIINNYFPSLAKIKLLCTKLTVNTLFDNVQTAELEVPELRSLNNESDNHNVVVLRNCANVEEFSAPIKVLGAGTAISGNAKLRVLRLPECDYIGGWSYDVPITNNPNLEEAYLNSYTPSTNSALANPIGNCPKLWKVVFGVVRSLTTWGGASSAFVSSDCTKVRHLEIGGAIVSFSLANWTPDAETIAHQDFLPNFREHIALRLTSNGSGKTLTLSQAVRDAIHAAEATYGIEAIIVTQKGWTLSPAPTA